jgi:lysophospholipase L1-like esterase
MKLSRGPSSRGLRLPSPLIQFALLALLLASRASPVAAQQGAPFETFDKIPYAYAQDLGRFRSIFQAQARAGTVRVAWMGDSQETSPFGAGSAYIPRLGYEFFLRYGNVPETQLSVPSSYGANGAGAEFLLQGSRQNAAVPRQSPSQLPPGLQSMGFRNRDVDEYPYLAHLVHDGRATGAGLRPQEYFKTGYRPAGDGPAPRPYGAVAAQIFAFANPAGSGEVAWEARPQPGSAQPSYFYPVTTSGTTSMGLVGNSVVKSQTVTLPLGAGNPYQQVLMYGTSRDVPTDILGVRFKSMVDARGVTVQDLAEGGYRTASYLQFHGNSGPVFAALDFDAAVLHYGANDAAAGVSAAQFKADQQALIAAVRSWAGDPQFKVILAGDPYRNDLPPAALAEFDRYAGAQQAIANEDANVMVLNGRRLTHDIGWTPDAEQSRWLGDGVHYTATGARALAAREVAALMGESTLSGDVNLSGRVDGSDFALLAGNFGRSGREWHEGDINFDGTVDGADFAVLAGNFGRSMNGAAWASESDWAALGEFAVAHDLLAPTVPEPGGAACALVCGAWLLFKRVRTRARKA